PASGRAADAAGHGADVGGGGARGAWSLPPARAGGALRGGGAQPRAHPAARVLGRAAGAGALRRENGADSRAVPDAGDGGGGRRDGGARREGVAGAGDCRLALGDHPGLGPRDERRQPRRLQRHAARVPDRPLTRGAPPAGVQSALVWLLLALPAALFQVLRNASMKRLGHVLDEYINVWGRFTFLLPWALVACVVVGFPAVEPGFYGWCLAFGVTQTLATLALSKALKLSDISPATAPCKVSLLILLGMAWGPIGAPLPRGAALLEGVRLARPVRRADDDPTGEGVHDDAVVVRRGGQAGGDSVRDGHRRLRVRRGAARTRVRGGGRGDADRHGPPRARFLIPAASCLPPPAAMEEDPCADWPFLQRSRSSSPLRRRWRRRTSRTSRPSRTARAGSAGCSTPSATSSAPAPRSCTARWLPTRARRSCCARTIVGPIAWMPPRSIPRKSARWRRARRSR